MGTPCGICAKHRGEGPLVGPVLFADELVVVTHRPLSKGRLPGYLFVETRRHTAGVADLSDDESRAVGWAVARAARALRRELAPEHVFSAITGRTWAHFHQHVFARPTGTPDEIPWFGVDEWAGARILDDAGLDQLCLRLSAHFEAA
ncbi:hypothetical protein ABZV58_09595 [Nocardia sp. NPDC004654]|uniref:hypothetical protein n=1 Tax=Nocardia sp. NPDC004654 TaxID=3154776 RepID=UPI0033A8F11C